MTVMPRIPKKSKSRRSSYVPPAGRSTLVPDALSWRGDLDGPLAPKGPAAWTAASSTDSGRTVIHAGPYGVIDLAVVEPTTEPGRRNQELGVVWWDKRSFRDEDDDIGTIQTSFVPASTSDHVSLAAPSTRGRTPRAGSGAPAAAPHHAAASPDVDETSTAPRHARSHTSLPEGVPGTPAAASTFDSVIAAQADAIAPPVPASRQAEPEDESDRQRHARRSRHVALAPAARPKRRSSPELRHARRSRLRRRRTHRRIVLGVVLVIVAFVTTLVVQNAIFTPFTVPSVSMENTLHPGDRILVDRLASGASSIHRGDVVVFSDPGGWLDHSGGSASAGNDDYLVKRVIGLPGDHVTCCSTDGRVTVNGRELQEPYTVVPNGQPAASPFDVTVPAGAIWVLGDNRSTSRDSSRTQDLSTKGFVPIANVVGHPVLKIWPFTQLSPIESANDTFASVPDQTCPI